MILETIAVVFILLWLLGVITSNAMGGFVHVLLIVAVVAILVRVIRGKSVL